MSRQLTRGQVNVVGLIANVLGGVVGAVAALAALGETDPKRYGAAASAAALVAVSGFLTNKHKAGEDAPPPGPAGTVTPPRIAFSPGAAAAEVIGITSAELRERLEAAKEAGRREVAQAREDEARISQLRAELALLESRGVRAAGEAAAVAAVPEGAAPRLTVGEGV